MVLSLNIKYFVQFCGYYLIPYIIHMSRANYYTNQYLLSRVPYHTSLIIYLFSSLFIMYLSFYIRQVISFRSP